MDDLDDLLDPGIRNVSGGTNEVRPGDGKLPHANAVLTLGILSIVGCILYGLPGLICGIIALSLHTKDKKIYQSDPSFYEESFKNSKGGWICAIIGTSISALYFLIALFAIGFALSAPF